MVLDYCRLHPILLKEAALQPAQPGASSSRGRSCWGVGVARAMGTTAPPVKEALRGRSKESGARQPERFTTVCVKGCWKLCLLWPESEGPHPTQGHVLSKLCAHHDSHSWFGGYFYRRDTSVLFFHFSGLYDNLSWELGNKGIEQRYNTQLLKQNSKQQVTKTATNWPGDGKRPFDLY